MVQRQRQLPAELDWYVLEGALSSVLWPRSENDETQEERSLNSETASGNGSTFPSLTASPITRRSQLFSPKDSPFTPQWPSVAGGHNAKN
ncbi:hypothetical protein OE88DRAFT_1658123 [Heliocybe sulcata]|uniref:Uncharacterized protein n=1 Tax=Heliocybe sulcata TaxID=5364 RepID=A0A5C3N685_9AGAM|nr:hypothetical protein OE88DRAFT_1658123 [Heliocybe sulcata]